MPISHDDVLPIILGNLTPYEVAHGVVYAADIPIAAGTQLKFPRISIDAPWTAFVAFVDREPSANWSHSSRYVLINRETGEIKSFEAKFPPFGSNQQMHWRALYKAPSVPSAAVVTS
jgi:hypothetical protein